MIRLIKNYFMKVKLKNELRDKIKIIQKEIINNIEDINSGGCIHFAYFFSKKLLELNIDHKICFTDDSDDFVNDENFICSHVMIYIPEVGLFDGYGFRQRNNYNYSTLISPNNDFLNNLRKDRQWSTVYDRYQNFKLYKIISNFK